MKRFIAADISPEELQYLRQTFSGKGGLLYASHQDAAWVVASPLQRHMQSLIESIEAAHQKDSPQDIEVEEEDVQWLHEYLLRNDGSAELHSLMAKLISKEPPERHEVFFGDE